MWRLPPTAPAHIDFGHDGPISVVRRHHGPSGKRASPREAARGADPPRPRRLSRSAHRPPSERIRAAVGRAAVMALRVFRVGRHRHRARAARRPVRRRPLYAAGARAGGRQPVRDRAGDGDAAPSVDRDGARRRPKARLRSVAAHRRGRRKAGQSLRGRRRIPGAGRAESGRCRVGRPPAGAARRSRAARAGIFRRTGGAETRPHPRRARQAQGRRARGLRSARGMLGLQHSRQRRSAHAARARIRDRAERRAAVALCRRPQARQFGAPSPHGTRGALRA